MPGDGSVVSGAGVDLPPRILNITTPQVGQRPLMAFRPFFMVSSMAPAISFRALHLTQYPSGIGVTFPESAEQFNRLNKSGLPYEQGQESVNSGIDSGSWSEVFLESGLPWRRFQSNGVAVRVRSGVWFRSSGVRTDCAS